MFELYAGTVIFAHAGTVAFITLGIPARWRALLDFPIRLNHVGVPEFVQQLIHGPVEASHRNPPCFELLLPPNPVT